VAFASASQQTACALASQQPRNVVSAGFSVGFCVDAVWFVGFILGLRSCRLLIETGRVADGCNLVRLDVSKQVDILASIDMRRSKVLKMLRSWRERFVDFCDRCARVCSAGCRAAAIRERALVHSLRWGTRL